MMTSASIATDRPRVVLARLRCQGAALEIRSLLKGTQFDW